MNIWVLSGNYDGEQFASSHLTEKGAILAAISDVLQLLGIEDEEDAHRIYNTRSSGVEENPGIKPPEWDLQKMRALPRNELWGIFGAWNEHTWDNSMGYLLEVIRTELEA